MSNRHSEPMLARPAAAASATTEALPAKVGAVAELPPEAEPDATVDEVLALLDADRYQTARELASAAVERFPDHRRVRHAWAMFDARNKAKVGVGGSEPPTDEEFAWLRDPPVWARGKWVALVGSEAVAVGESLADVQKSIGSRTFPKRPLVHRIADG